MDAQKDKYQEFQFNNIKQDPTVVAEAQEISSEEDQVRQAGFYDIDQAFLETDPTVQQNSFDVVRMFLVFLFNFPFFDKNFILILLLHFYLLHSFVSIQLILLMVLTI